MNLTLSAEQKDFAAALHDLLSAAVTTADQTARAQLTADQATRSRPAADRALWSRLADVGVTALAVPSRWGGLDASPADLVVACEELGHHAVSCPVTESLVAVPALLTALGDERLCDKWLPELAAGRVFATLAAPPWLPYAVDAGTADLILLAEQDTVSLALPTTAHPSIDHTRRLFEVSPAAPLATGAAAAVSRALDLGALACAAQLLGAGRALLEMSVDYARTRVQFGRPIGQFQAVKHRLADVAVALEFARPLLHAAAVSAGPTIATADAAVDGPARAVPALSEAVGAGGGTAARDVSAAKVACADAAHRAARAALQVHGAIGYTQEHELGRFLTKVRALTLAWGTPSDHRSRVMRELTRWS